MSYPIQTLVNRVRFHLGDMGWETTGQAVSASSVVQVADGDDWKKGDYGEFVADGDAFYVSDDPSGFDLTCVRGYYGSTAAAHASGSRIVKEPKYKYGEILNAASATIQGFFPWPRVYKVASTTITPAPSSQTWYSLASDAMGLINVYQIDDAGRERRHYGQHHQYNRVIMERHLPTSFVSAGIALRFPDGFIDADNTVYVTYAAKLTDALSSGNFVDFTDSNATVEALIFGTVALLQGSLELRKPRRGAAETNNLQSASYFNRVYHSALYQAEKELRQNSPLMQTPRTD